MKHRALAIVVLLLVGPAVVTMFSRRWGLAVSAFAVVVLVYLVLRSEGKSGPA